MASGCVWGIDLGRSSLKAVRMREGKEELEILALCYLEYAMQEDGTIPHSEQLEALEELIRRHPEVKKERLYVALPGQASFSRFIKLPGFDASRLDEMIGFEAQQQIPFPLDEVIWDYALVEPDDEDADDREVGLFAIKKELVYSFLGDLQLSGLEPDGLTIAPLASYNFVRFDVDYKDRKAAVVLDIGFDHTDLMVIDGERYWLRNLTLSGQELTKAVATRMKQSVEEAEELKRDAAGAGDKEARKVYQATQLVLKDFVSEIHRSIGFYKAQNKGRRVEVGEIVLLGNGSKLASIRPFFQKELGYPVGTVKRLTQLVYDEDLSHEDMELLQENLPAFSVAFGLGVQGCGHGTNRINLLPEELRLKKALKKKQPIVAAAVALLFVWVALASMIASSSLETTESVIGTARTYLSELERNQREIEQLQDVSELEEEVERLVAYTRGRAQPLELLNMLAMALPQENDALIELTPDHERSLMQGHREATIRQVERDLRRAMERVNEQKVWLLDLDVRTVYVAAGKLAPGSRVERRDGTEVAVDRDGYFRTELDQVGGTVRLIFVEPDEYDPGMEHRSEREVLLQPAVRATLHVAKRFDTDEKDELEALEAMLIKPIEDQGIRGRAPAVATSGTPVTLYALEPDATTPPTPSGFGQPQQVQKFLSQRYVVEYPDARALVAAAQGSSE